MQARCVISDLAGDSQSTARPLPWSPEPMTSKFQPLSNCDRAIKQVTPRRSKDSEISILTLQVCCACWHTSWNTSVKNNLTCFLCHTQKILHLSGMSSIRNSVFIGSKLTGLGGILSNMWYIKITHNMSSIEKNSHILGIARARACVCANIF